MFRLKIKEIAQQKKISQRQLFLRSGVDIRTVRSIFRDPETNITMETLARLAYVLNCDMSLLIESDPPLPKNLDEPVRVGPPPWYVVPDTPGEPPQQEP
jgi:transcriptional regulator with XRE-family HTH domain